nr:MAG TPA: hypothetical protein [Caudoviricetes sp.]
MPALYRVPAENHKGHIAENLFTDLRLSRQLVFCDHKGQILPQYLKFFWAKNPVQFIPERRLFGAFFLFVHPHHLSFIAWLYSSITKFLCQAIFITQLNFLLTFFYLYVLMDFRQEV